MSAYCVLWTVITINLSPVQCSRILLCPCVQAADKVAVWVYMRLYDGNTDRLV